MHDLRFRYMDRLGLAWVLVDGRPRSVSDFAALPPRRRPAASCPQCGRRLTLKLGCIRRHHAAHAPNDLCEATQPETALHLDTKLYLAAQLQSVLASDPALVIRQRCEGSAFENCAAEREEQWVKGWDEVVVEAGVATGGETRLRPDIILRKSGVAIAAIEILVSHRVPDEKAAVLERTGLPWIEVRAGAELLEGDTAWRTNRALPVERLGRRGASQTWRCAEHVRRSRRLRGARVVDIYRDGGIRERAIYRMDEQVVEDAVIALVLSRDGREVASRPCDEKLLTQRAAWRALRIAFTEDVQHIIGDSGVFADSPMRWASGDAATNLVEESLHDVHPGDATPLATRYPRRWYFVRERGRWFLPADMRGVRWDRPEHDAFTPHPAWTASRALVRERPVPEYAWQGGVIFARRPSPAAFGVAATQLPNGGIAVCALEPEAATQPQRALVVLTAPVEEYQVRALERSLEAKRVEHLWLSHPRDWSGSRADLPWAAAGRDARGRDIVLVDGVGVFRASAFVEAFRRGDAKLRPGTVVARMSARVAALRER